MVLNLSSSQKTLGFSIEVQASDHLYVVLKENVSFEDVEAIMLSINLEEVDVWMFMYFLNPDVFCMQVIKHLLLLLS